MPIIAVSMTLNELFALLRSVLLSREVLVVTVAIALYINVVNYIVGYRKRPKRRLMTRKKAAPKPASAGDGGEEDGIEDDDANEDEKK